MNKANLGGENWVSKSPSLREGYGVFLSDNVCTIKSKIRNYFGNLIMSSLKEELQQNKKLFAYAQVKSIFKFEMYLDVIVDFKMLAVFV